MENNFPESFLMKANQLLLPARHVEVTLADYPQDSAPRARLDSSYLVLISGPLSPKILVLSHPLI